MRNARCSPSWIKVISWVKTPVWWTADTVWWIAPVLMMLKKNFVYTFAVYF